MKFVNGGICAAKGFTASGVHCGIRHNKSKKDLALIYSEVPASAAAVYTKNLVKGAPLILTAAHLENGVAQAIICNSGNANTCNENGPEIAEKTCRLLSKELNVKEDDIVIASTGVIGQKMKIGPFEAGIPPLVGSLSKDGCDDAAEGIMTTDTVKKEVAVRFEIEGKTCTIGGIAKGSGMIHPDMATMLVFITSDVDISPEMLKLALSTDVKSTFNMLSIDGDTSTNDMAVVLSNGLAGNEKIVAEDENYSVFMKALNTVTVSLCRMIAGDGEGATRLLECTVTGAKTEADAKAVAKSVVCSSLLKAAMFGADANWGRVICAAGYSGADVDINKIDISFKSAAGQIQVCENGHGLDFSEEDAKKILSEDEIDIVITLDDGDYDAKAWGCDLTYDYVKINGDYRT
ncbi:MAG: bifunctional glutamate N-acetyltransferase/amino-acid acetyltransferase ArgJ [Clostridia bacterium]|nr:bifunctional glutamate N-acetyltransferase/amino-acid acetyltransferase ArgJ [Clostridia bacterium]